MAIGPGDLERYRKFLNEADLSDCDNPLEATALENGFIPESKGLAAVDLARRIMSSLPHIAYMASRASRPRQPTDRGKSLLRRQDAAPRTYWLRDWQCGEFTKAYECMEDTVVKKKHSVAQVIRPNQRDQCMFVFYPTVRDPDAETLEKRSRHG